MLTTETPTIDLYESPAGYVLRLPERPLSRDELRSLRKRIDAEFVDEDACAFERGSWVWEG